MIHFCGATLQNYNEFAYKMTPYFCKHILYIVVNQRFSFITYLKCGQIRGLEVRMHTPYHLEDVENVGDMVFFFIVAL